MVAQLLFASGAEDEALAPASQPKAEFTQAPRDRLTEAGQADKFADTFDALIDALADKAETDAGFAAALVEIHAAEKVAGAGSPADKALFLIASALVDAFLQGLTKAATVALLILRWAAARLEFVGLRVK